MSTEENKAIVRRFYDVFLRGNLDEFDELIALNYVRHDPRPGAPPPGPAGQKLIAAALRTAFSNLQERIDLLIAEADLVVARWTLQGTHSGPYLNIPPTGKQVRFTGVNIFRLADGKIVEIWNHRDDLGLLQQLNAIPTPGQIAGA